MINILRIGKAAPVYPWSYLSEVVDRTRMWRWGPRVFNAEGAFSTGLIWGLGRDQRTVARDDFLLTCGIHGKRRGGG